MKKRYLIIFIILTISAFLYGVGVGYNYWPPFQFIQYVKTKISSKASTNTLDTNFELQFLNTAFKKTLIKGDKIYPPITTIDGVYKANFDMLVDAKEFFTAYSDMVIEEAKQFTIDNGTIKILKVDFSLKGKKYSSYAYSLPSNTGDSVKTASLIIPGSGSNQGTAIYERVPNNYHYGILEALKVTNGDVFIYIKPNESILAFHNGKYKLGYDNILNYQLNNGGSYSASYIVMSMAIMKYMKSNYEHTVVAGLSQGGTASLLIALQSHPDYAIVSSGYSAIFEKLDDAAADQIVIPDLYSRVLNTDSLSHSIKNINTQFLFTWGIHESGVYGIEATRQLTKSLLSSANNVTCIIHNSAHSFPVDEISSFLKPKGNN